MTDVELDVNDEKQSLFNIDNKIKYPAIFILGAQGVGKSTLGNMLLGSYTEPNVPSKFQVSHGYEEKEELYHTTEINIKGEKYSIIDTIGIPESSTDSDEIWSKLKKIEELTKSVQAYIFVLEGGRLTQHGLLFIHQLFTKYPKSRTIVVFTKVRKSLILSSTEMKKTFNTQISTLLQSINDRWIVMPSLDLFGNSEGKSVIESFIDDLKKMITSIENKGNIKKGGKRKKEIHFRGVKPQNMELKKKFFYGCLIVVIVTAIISVILSIKL